MQPFTPDDLTVANQFYRSIENPNAKRLLDFLIDHPDKQRTAADLQQQLGFPEHRDVARATYELGTVAASLNRTRPWNEGQLGYRMPEEMAALFQRAREGAS